MSMVRTVMAAESEVWVANCRAGVDAEFARPFVLPRHRPGTSQHGRTGPST